MINIFFLVSINLLIKPFYIFGIDRMVQNIVGKETFGIYFALFNFTYLLQIINDFGIHYYNNRNIAQHSQLIHKYFPNILMLKLFLSTIYLFFVFGLAMIFDYDIQIYHLILAIAINQILVSLLFYLRSNISGLGYYRTDSIISALDKLLMIIVCGILLYVPAFSKNFQIEWFIYAQTATLATSAFISFWVVKRHLKVLQFKFNKAFLFLILKESYPYALAIFLMTVYTRVDAVMIERMLSDGAAEAGIYASAYRLLDAVNMIGFLFAGLLLPMFAKLIQAKESFQELLRLSFGLIWAGAISISIPTFFFQKEIMELLYWEATPYWGEVLGYLILTFIAVSGTYIWGSLLTANGNLKKMNIIFAIGIVANIILNYFLILKFKAAGAAMATVLTQFFVLFAEMLLAVNIFQMKVNYSLILKIILFIIAVVGISYGFASNTTFDWRLRFIMNGGVAFLAAVVFGLIDLKMIKEMKKIN